MTQPPNTPDPVSPAPPADDNTTGLPLLKTWPAVYFVVFTIFVLWVVLLWLFTRNFS